MMSPRILRGQYEESYDHLILKADEIDCVVEQYIWKASNLGYDPEEVWSEGEILQKTLTRSTLYNYKHCHLRVVE